MRSKKYKTSRILTGLVLVMFIANSSCQMQQTKNINPVKLPLTTAPAKYIYLSFDDGPLNGSENIDSVILGERLKISVFVVGEHAEKSKQLGTYYKLYEQNPFVEVYNHSYTHANNKYELFYSNPENVLADIQKNEQLLNLRYKIVRLPGRNIWRVGGRKRDDETSGSKAADLLEKSGYKIYGWDIEWQHHASNGTPVQSVDEMVKEIETRLENGNTFTQGHIIILLHDEMFQKKWEESELKHLIDTMRMHQNYEFEHIRFYPEK